MVYLDTSLVVPIFIREPSSEAIIGWLQSSSAPLAMSDWTLVEFASATSIKVRTGQITRNTAKHAITHANAFAQKHCTVATPGRESFQRAAELASESGLNLRAGDALHLAIAASLNATAVVSLDEEMIAAAKVLGMTVVAIQP
jgi:predicted nucleic acid-binding protein